MSERAIRIILSVCLVMLLIGLVPIFIYIFFESGPKTPFVISFCSILVSVFVSIYTLSRMRRKP